MNYQQFEIFKPNGTWVSSKKYPSQAEAEAAALQKSREYGETYAVREIGGYTLAIVSDGRVYTERGE